MLSHRSDGSFVYEEKREDSQPFPFVTQIRDDDDNDKSPLIVFWVFIFLFM
ncbi:hypothetical protein BVRB_8g193810 isoform B [Beta vulgaris subsp. vulgaris]|nr:hypothetical protein BVRB_8g193810 isoform B [Beta vulgaris subsp. vulgaris]